MIYMDPLGYHVMQTTSELSPFNVAFQKKACGPVTPRMSRRRAEA